MGLRISVLLTCTWLLAGCFTRRTEEVPDPTVSDPDSAANGGAMDAASDSAASNGGQTDAMVTIACESDKPCTRADLSLCDKDTDSCVPCKVSRDCDDIAGKSACIKNVGCFECTDDTCVAPSALCHPTRHECVACTAGDTAACDADSKVCEPQSGACVACLSNAQCTDASKAKCEPGKNECGKCAVNDDCKHLTNTPYCDAAAGKCVACTSNAQCTDAKASRCDLSTNTCAGCGGPSDCIGIKDATSKDSLPLCVSQECVECTRGDRALCGSNVCNALTKRCEDGVTTKSANLCQACVSDDQCATGQRCVERSFDSGSGLQPVGYFCQWAKAGGGAAPAVCNPSGRPFVSEKALPSIDGAGTTAMCTHRTASCEAYSVFSKACGRYAATNVIVSSYVDELIPVANRGTPATAQMITADNSVCGLGGTCVAQNADDGVYLCSHGCIAAEDCKTGSSCTSGSNDLCNVN